MLIRQRFPRQKSKTIDSPKFYPARVLRYTVPDGHDFSNEAHCELRTAKKEQGNAVFAVHYTVKGV